MSETPHLPIVALHGFTGSGLDFELLAPQLERPLIAPDLPGHGQQAEAECSFAAVVRQFDAAELPEFELWGYSLGGRLALSYALDTARPERIKRLVLIGATAGIEDDAERAQRRGQDEALAQRIERDGVAAFLEHWQALPLIQTQERIDPAARAAMQERRRQSSAAGWAASLRGLGTGVMPPRWGELGRIEPRTVLVVGKEDAKFLALAERLAQGLPQATLAVLPGAGHCAHLEAPDAFLRALAATP